MKPFTHAVVLSSLLLATGTSVFGYFDHDNAALDRLGEYASEVDVAQGRYDALRDVWVKQVGDTILTSDQYKAFEAEQVVMNEALVNESSESAEADALDGFRLFWHKDDAKPLIKKVHEADLIHAANSGVNSLVTMAASTCEGNILTKDQYAAAGLDTAAGIATYDSVVKAWKSNEAACDALEEVLKRVAQS
ncbi:hypothetical protein [Aeromicrobium sp. 179-A 4D2 NHS]|uniref:hypothetical protein n=1 Tax=Aeromicrobium sp. 179-A 4D2 NHS TaxID=3142375 RepID=UPI0039A0FC73